VGYGGQDWDEGLWGAGREKEIVTKCWCKHGYYQNMFIRNSERNFY
jgi:hypothetical protein